MHMPSASTAATLQKILLFAIFFSPFFQYIRLLF
jgi:hypothetical protein